MSKFIKVLAVIMSAVMLTVFPVSAFAEETSSHEYKLSELLSMNKDDFFNLGDKAKRLYRHVNADCPTTYNFFSSSNDEAYIKNTTEKKIEELIDTKIGDIELKLIASPALSTNTVKYADVNVADPKYTELDITTDEGRDEVVLNTAKITYCLQQTLPSFFVLTKPLDRPTPNNKEATLLGDVDLDGYVDLADLTTLAKYNLSNSSFPLANDTAYANADMNGDGKVDGLDTSALIENQLGK